MKGPSTQILRSDDAQDREAWLAAWRECGREPFAHPAYVELFAHSQGEQARCLVARDDSGTAIVPFILRPVSHNVQGLRSGLSDAISPYGYGGPYGTSKTLASGVWPLASEWMHEEGVVSLFARLALNAPEPDLPDGAAVRPTADNVVVDLALTEAEQWLRYEHKVRKNVKKALRAELSATIRPRFSDLDEFVELYHDTMSRRSASSFYFFDRTFFVAIQDGLPESYVAAEVRDATGRLVSAELVLTSDQFLYSFLGGTREDAFPMAPNDLLKHAVIGYGRTTGRRGFVLGGGYSAGDGIFRYKRSFDPTGSVPFRTLRLIADSPTYDRLTEAHAHEQSGARSACIDDDFFPAYRGPAPSRSPDPEPVGIQPSLIDSVNSNAEGPPEA